MGAYHRMTWTDRLIIERHFNAGKSYRAISEITGFSVSSLHREIKRGLYDHLDGATWKTIKRYSAQIADDLSKWLASSRCPSVKLDHNYEYAHTVAQRIQSGESPDAITGDLRKQGKWTVSTNTLYRYIDRGYIPGVTNKDLLVKPSRKREYNQVRATKPPRGTSIERRPLEINSRLSAGHWEMDTVIGKAKGKRQTLLVLTERKTRYELIFKLTSKAADCVCSKLEAIVPTFPKGTFQTITVDNGTEFSDPERMEKLGFMLYYCHPYCSSERGSNENANRLIRRHFPKSTSLYHVTQKMCDNVSHAINSMHRKILGYSSAAELFNEWQSTLA